MQTGNLYDRFPTEEAALAFMRELIDANGADIVDTLALGGRDEAGHTLPVASGAALARRAQAEEADRRPLARRS